LRTKSAVKLSLVLVAIIFLGYVALFGLQIGLYEIVPLGNEVRQGLDLRGGLYVVYEAQTEPGDPEADRQIDGAMRVMRNRLDGANQHEATIARQGERRIVVEIPGVDDPAELADILAEPAVLEFIGPEGDVIITGRDVSVAEPGFGDAQRAVVNFELHPEGAQKFADATTRYVGQAISIVLDGVTISEPQVRDAILGGRGFIDGMENMEAATRLANLIESGALPVNLTQLETRTIGATLGANALEMGLLSGIVGIAIVLVFMLLFYRLPGLVANIGLIVYLLITMVIIVASQVTLTLPGIGGLILSVGMAVDANVIIFERIREELRLGKTIRVSVDTGFSKALSAILDGNVTTLIAAIVLYFYGTGPIQGFAITLIIGIVASMFTALIFTKFVMKTLINLNIYSNRLYGV